MKKLHADQLFFTMVNLSLFKRIMKSWAFFNYILTSLEFQLDSDAKEDELLKKFSLLWYFNIGTIHVEMATGYILFSLLKISLGSTQW